jgi:hypothetical protein
MEATYLRALEEMTRSTKFLISERLTFFVSSVEILGGLLGLTILFKDPI